MQRPLRSPPRRKEIHLKNTDCSLGFVVGLSIGITIVVAYYSRFINFMDPSSSIM